MIRMEQAPPPLRSPRIGIPAFLARQGEKITAGILRQKPLMLTEPAAVRVSSRPLSIFQKDARRSNPSPSRTAET